MLASLLIELTPGPNMAYLAVVSAVHGRKAGFCATAGIATGLALIGFIAAFGLAAIIAKSSIIYELLRWAGIAYLLWLAWEGWRDTPEPQLEHVSVIENGAKYFKQGVVTNILNPKAALFYIVVLPTFIDATRHVLSQTLFFSLIYVVIATMVHISIVLLAGTARPFLNNQDKSRIARRFLSVVLALVALWFGYSTAR